MGQDVKTPFDLTRRGLGRIGCRTLLSIERSEVPMLGGGLVCHHRLRSSYSLLTLPIAAGLIRATCTAEPVMLRRRRKPPGSAYALLPASAPTLTTGVTSLPSRDTCLCHHRRHCLPITKCGDTLLDHGDPECHHKMRARWRATGCT